MESFREREGVIRKEKEYDERRWQVESSEREEMEQERREKM